MTLEFLYGTKLGRILLKPLVRPGLSKFCGKLLDTNASKILIKPFIKNNGIDMSEYQDEKYTCFNDCFCRKIRPECRPIDMNGNNLISPCDGLLSAYKITDGLVIPVKGSSYSMMSLLRNSALASEYEGGTCLVFRLCVNHYHRYIYPDNGTKGDNIFIPGVLHTVRPVALAARQVFVENSREYTVINSENFGPLVQMEVGAMLVGKISNNMGAGVVKRGEEKGKFLYGGSTIIMLVKKDAASVKQEYFDATSRSEELPVKMGQVIGGKE
ncbi:MAG: phosphatidylserine decarboxylase [Saccharofermentans sp.]|nr:phosphatidylserine decarboxylase [Saccharofermentans sp.]